VDQSNVINLALMGITAIGVIVAVVQAKHARDDAKESKESSKSAREQADRSTRAAEVSAGAEQRTASALEEIVALTKSQIPTDPWLLTKIGPTKYEVRNISKETMFAVVIDELGEGDDITPYEDEPTHDVGPGESLYFGYVKRIVSPPQTTVQISWGDPMTGERSTWRRTIS
jgi:hypothetical protein